MADAVGTSHGSFLVPEPDRRIRVAALRGLSSDPLLRLPAGIRHVATKLLADSDARLHQAADSLDLGDALESGEVAFSALVSVPVRTPRGLQGLALLYFVPDAALPAQDAMAHLQVISRSLSASLELARALETVRNAERSLQLALAGTASVRGLDEVVTFLLDLRDRLGGMRKQPDAPSWFLSEFAHLAPSLAGALSTARSLLAFSRGELQREAVGVQELLGELRAPALSVQVDPGVTAVSGDAVLLRLALSALIDHVRGGTDATPLQLRATTDGGRVRLSADSVVKRAADADFNLVRRIVELHGGSVAQEAAGASGTRYTLSLPAA